MKRFFTDCLTNKIRLVTSAVTVEEYMVHPYSSGEIEYVHKFEDFINLSDTLIIPIDDTIAHCAARIRARYKSFKAMDAMQLAAAVECGCTSFLTNDKRLLQFGDIRCILVADLP